MPKIYSFFFLIILSMTNNKMEFDISSILEGWVGIFLSASEILLSLRNVITKKDFKAPGEFNIPKFSFIKCKQHKVV